MTGEQIFWICFYGTFAAGALWATWPDEDLFVVGVALALSFAVSNLLWFFAPIEARPGIYSMLELFIMVAAYSAWQHDGDRPLIGIVCLNMVSIAACIAFASIIVPTTRQKNAFEVTTNLTFAAECLLAIWVGVSHGYRVGRFHRRFFGWGRHPESHVARRNGK